MNNKYFYCNVVGDTNVGCKRKANEDWLDSFESDNGLVAVVCDGMGGHVGGQVASHVAVEAIRSFLTTHYYDDPRTAIVAACNAANQAILQRANLQPELTGMGSTCVLLIVREGLVYIGSIGDSRVYLVRSKRIVQLTKDQSYVQMLVDMGEITKEEAEHHPRKNEITNALGLPNMQPATVLPEAISPEAGDCFLLCSDGLSGMVPDREILKIASNQAGLSQRDRVNTLINSARHHGGLDNITCQIVEFSVTPPMLVKKSEKIGQAFDKSLMLKYGILAACALLAIVGFVVWNPFGWGKGDEESQFLKELRNQEGTKVEKMTDTLLYVPSEKPFMAIREIQQYGAIDIKYVKSDGHLDSLTIRRSLSISQMQVKDDDILEIRRQGTTAQLFFTNKSYEKKELILLFRHSYKQADETSVDSTFAYVFPVKVPEKPTSNRPVAPVATPKPTGGVVLVDATIEEEVPTTPPADNSKPQEVTIKVNPSKPSTIIKLISKDGTNTNTELYTDDGIKQYEKRDKWYHYSCIDQRECTIEIINKEVPNQQAKIEIPLLNGGTYTIRVTKERTR